MAVDRSAALDVWRELLQFHRRAVSVLDAELRTERGLSLDEYDILLQLVEGPAEGLKMGQLAEGAVIARSSCTRVVDHLVRAGLVERIAAAVDRRSVLVTIARMRPRCSGTASRRSARSAGRVSGSASGWLARSIECHQTAAMMLTTPSPTRPAIRIRLKRCHMSR